MQQLSPHKPKPLQLRKIETKIKSDLLKDCIIQPILTLKTIVPGWFGLERKVGKIMASPEFDMKKRGDKGVFKSI